MTLSRDTVLLLLWNKINDFRKGIFKEAHTLRQVSCHIHILGTESITAPVLTVETSIVVHRLVYFANSNGGR